MAHTKFLKAGVMGWPVSHSLSPRLHGYWLKKYGIEGLYEALPVEPCELEVHLRELSAHGFQGVNLTKPHKEVACALVDDLDSAAQRIGAINLVLTSADGKLHGLNTDAYGFEQSLFASGFSYAGGSAFVLGAGGASRAIITALAGIGFSDIRVSNRTFARAEKLAAEFTTDRCTVRAVDWKEAPSRLIDVTLLVNTTSLGMTGQPMLDFDIGLLNPAAVVTDIVYSPLLTNLLKRAQAQKHLTVDGLGMLLHQARPAFRAFFGYDPEVTEDLRRYVLESRRE